MSSEPRIPKTEVNGIYGGLVKTMSRRQLGLVPDSLGVMWHNRDVLNATYALGRKTKKWDECDEQLKSLAHMAVSAYVGCSFCMDFGYYAAHSQGLDTSKLGDIPFWRESTAFTPQERRVLEYAEAMTVTPPEVTDEMAEALRRDLGNEAFIELTMMVAVENERSRLNSALGLTSQGFKDHCELRPAGA